jgi:hypothetical protein
MMQTNTKQLFSMLFLALAGSGTAWFCSRSADGRPAEFLMMWAVIGLIHCIADCKFQKRFFNLQMLGIYLVALLIGFSQSKLEEMGGILILIPPIVVIAICIISGVTKWICKSKKAN